MKNLEIKTLGTRSTIFTYDLVDWKLNVHLIEADNYNYVIDTGLGSDCANDVLNYLSSKNNEKPIRIINTHHHFDHVWGNAFFKDSDIYAHEKCIDYLNQHWDSDVDKCSEYKMGDVIKCIPNIVVHDSYTFEEDDIYLYHNIGHTMDGLVVYDKIDNLINIGDNIGDEPNELLPSLEVSEATYKLELEKILKLAFTDCVSGHNIILKKEILEQFKDSL